MISVDPADSVRIAETDLRRLVRSVLEQELGPNWLAKSGLSEQRLERIPERMSEEAKRRKSVVTSIDPLDFLEVTDLATIISKHWAEFKPILGDKKHIDTYMSRLASFRNPSAHSRPLMAHEKMLLAGIAGEIRNLVTIHRSSQDVTGDYYPVIESVHDNFGHATGPTGLENMHIVPTNKWLQVGDVLRWECAGRDPQGRELTWRVAHHGRRPIQAIGETASLEWTVSEEDVGDRFQPDITLTAESKYHRHTGYDDRVYFVYGVVPPSP
ncbi:Swt1 family HEPN domain-containing protein [Demequina sp. SO4-13]|uniref:Swt1 family HEPN domain-containing protein n=1 Tax=Demequina sp. SO4-13 TaxID=3401027 RepID=UPI003AF90701